MAKVEFLGPMDKKSLEVSVNSLHELKEILNEDDSLKEWLEICSIAINGEMATSLNTPINKDDTICLLPPVCGG